MPPSSSHRFARGDYAALSYVWGDEHNTRTILLNGQRRRVTYSLERTLWSFHEQAEFQDDFKVWVDAICINQDDQEERGQQIGKMRDIYGTALAVIAWLGEQGNQSGSAFQLLHDLAVQSQAGSNEQLVALLLANPNYLGKGCWLALQMLMERTYWSRLWVVQEMAMGGSSTWLRCGSSCMNWSALCTGVAVLEEHLWLIKDDLLAKQIRERRLTREPIWTITSLHLVYHDLSVVSKLIEQSSSQYLSLGRLLDLANAADCKDPRDKVYALVGLMDPRVARCLVSNYTKSPAEVYTTAARAFMQAYDNLEPLREANPWGATKTPSWVADWQWESRIRWSRVESELWGPAWLRDLSVPNTSYISYSASGDSKHDATFSDDNSLLCCTGFIIDAINGLSARALDYFTWPEESIIQPTHWKSTYGDYGATAQALYRTLISDRVSGQRKACDRHTTAISQTSINF